MEISFCSHPSTNKVIATKFGTWHDSLAVVACAKFCCDMINCNWIRAKWIFHRIWIVMEKSLVKWVPDTYTSRQLHNAHRPNQFYPCFRWCCGTSEIVFQFTKKWTWVLICRWWPRCVQRSYILYNLLHIWYNYINLDVISMFSIYFDFTHGTIKIKCFVRKHTVKL